MCLCVIDNERTEGLLVRGSLCWPVKELESESTIQTTVGHGLPHTHGNTKAERVGGVRGGRREVTAHSKSPLVCVFPQEGGKTFQGLAAAKEVLFVILTPDRTFISHRNDKQ